MKIKWKMNELVLRDKYPELVDSWEDLSEDDRLGRTFEEYVQDSNLPVYSENPFRELWTFGEEYAFAQSSQDYLRFGDEVTGAMLLIRDGEYEEVWICEESRPFDVYATYQWWNPEEQPFQWYYVRDPDNESLVKARSRWDAASMAGYPDGGLIYPDLQVFRLGSDLDASVIPIRIFGEIEGREW